MGCHFLLQGIFLTQRSHPHLLGLLHWQVGSLPLGIFAIWESYLILATVLSDRQTCEPTRYVGKLRQGEKSCVQGHTALRGQYAV